MSNLRNAAIVLMNLPQDEAAQLLSKFKPKQFEAVSQEIAKLGRFTADEQEQALKSLAESNPDASGGGADEMNSARTLLENAIRRNAASRTESHQQTVERLPFGFLKSVDPQSLLTFIDDEHPQTIALILSHLSASYAAQIIAGLRPDRQLQVIRRIAHMGRTSPEIVRQVAQSLENRMEAVINESYGRAGGVPTVAEILNASEHTAGRLLLDGLSQEDPDLVEEIRRRMFVIEDISSPGDKDIQ